MVEEEKEEKAPCLHQIRQVSANFGVQAYMYVLEEEEEEEEEIEEEEEEQVEKKAFALYQILPSKCQSLSATLRLPVQFQSPPVPARSPVITTSFIVFKLRSQSLEVSAHFPNCFLIASRMHCVGAFINYLEITSQLSGLIKHWSDY